MAFNGERRKALVGDLPARGRVSIKIGDRDGSIELNDRQLAAIHEPLIDVGVRCARVEKCDKGRAGTQKRDVDDDRFYRSRGR